MTDDPAVIQSVPVLMRRLAEDARGVAEAEVALFKAKVEAKVDPWRRAAVFFAAAALLAYAALIALLVGGIVTLATLIGPGLATLAVIGGTLAIALILAQIGKRMLRTGGDE